MWRIAWILVRADWRRHAGLSLRRLGFMVMLAAGAVFFGASLPAVNFRLIGTFQHASYDVTAGGYSDALDEVLSAVRTLGGNALAVYQPMLDVYHGDRVARSATAFLYESRDWNRAEATYFSKGLRIAGRPAPGFVGLDRLTADRLGVVIGDRVRYTLDVAGAAPKEAEGVVRAIYATTDQARGIIAPAASSFVDATEGAKASAMPVRIFVTTQGEPSVLADELKAKYGDRMNVETLPEGFRRGERAFDETVDRNVRFSLTWFAVLMYGTFVYRELLGRFDRRAGTVAVLSSLGMSGRAVFGVFALEQALMTGLATAGGFLGGIRLLTGLGELYVPPDARIAFAFYVTVAGIVALSASAVAVRARLSRLPVARLLGAP